MGIKDAPIFNPEHANKINKLDITSYFDDYMRRRPQNNGGYINLAKENFWNMAERSKTSADFQTMVYAYVNYVGHKNILPQKYADFMMMKALENDQALVVLDMFRLHTELLYHPHPEVTRNYFEYFKSKDYDSLILFFNAIKGNYLLQRPEGLMRDLIEVAFEKGDKKMVIEAYADILDYEQEKLTYSHYQKVLASLSHKDQIDHALAKITERNAEKYLSKDDKLKLKIYFAVYYFHAKGYLTVVDHLKEIAKEQVKIENSQLVKEEFFDLVKGDVGSKIDEYIKKQVLDAIKGLKGLIDEEFYDLKDMLKVAEVKKEEEL